MTRNRVYVDSGILIIASKAKDDALSQRVIEELDKDFDFLFSAIVEIETLPKPIFHGYPNQVQMLKDFFAIAERIECTSQVQENAIDEASKDNLGPGDALHVACALSGKATELLTHEKKGNTLSRARSIPVRTLSNA